MVKIIHKEELAKDVTKIVVEAPVIAKRAKAGQFVVVVVDEQGERIPLTIADWDKDAGNISLIFQKIGFTTKKLGAMNTGDYLQHVLGPLGHATQVRKLGTVICIGGGVGIAEVYPVSRAFKQADNRLIGIIGARAKDMLILEKEMRDTCDRLLIATDDGSYGIQGLVTDLLKTLLTSKLSNSTYELVYAIGPVPMMRAVSELTRDYKIPTIVSLNPVMVDATGMCATCRCTVAGKTVFGCVDGPEFDGHLVDFTELERRLKLFREQEEAAKGKPHADI